MQEDFFDSEMFKKELSEYEAIEIENRFAGRIEIFLKENPQGKIDFEKKISVEGSILMLRTLTGWTHCFENNNPIFNILNKIQPHRDLVPNEVLKSVLRSNIECHDSTNISAIVAFAIGLTKNCKDKEKEAIILKEFESQRQHFIKRGEMDFAVFCFNIEEMKYWVNEMCLKESVYKEIDEIENSPIPEK